MNGTPVLNPHEALCRQGKAAKLAAVIDAEIVRTGQIVTARMLRDAGEDFWHIAALQAGCNPPNSMATVEAVILILRGMAAERKESGI